jgi:hypothetical protein
VTAGRVVTAEAWVRKEVTMTRIVRVALLLATLAALLYTIGAPVNHGG